MQQTVSTDTAAKLHVDSAGFRNQDRIACRNRNKTMGEAFQAHGLYEPAPSVWPWLTAET
ncbi:hypothetical protein C2L65_24525 [Paraburkholderia terrae]|uniref:Uncharacterized protein n=1 Tax=Paraburkholderia terrae TaxID=311230 RepID=A0A2I8ETD7_9BURK|nr:hypothetical protein C2L65_24525 [Paraburkholderia terrae]